MKLNRRFNFVLLLLFLSFCLQACTAAPEEDNQLRQFQRTFLGSFDTVTQVVGYERNEDAFNEVCDEIEKRLMHFHQLYTIYDDNDESNNLKKLNEGAAEKPMPVDPLVMDLLKEGKTFTLKTNGSFNCCLGSVLSLWHDARERAVKNPAEASLPSKEELAEASSHCNPEDLILDEKSHTVFFKDPELKLDLGGLAKGYVVERLARELEAEGVNHYLISAGGNVRSIGDGLPDRPWRIGIQNPDPEKQGLLDTVALHKGAVVTSGTYERFFICDGKRYHHIIDPVTLFPSDRYQSVSVQCANSGTADALSTALFNMSIEDGEQLAEQFEAAVLWLDNAGELHMNARWKEIRLPADAPHR